MKCPRCVQRIHRAAESCPHCAYSMADADSQFGDFEVRLRCLADEAGLFRRPDRERLERAMEAFRRRFPQLFFAVHSGSHGDRESLREFGVWLLNRGAFEDLPEGRGNEGGVLLSIDAESKSAGLSFGYLLDPFLDESDTFECLIRAHAYWLEGRFAEGVLRCLLQIEQLLTRRCRQARRDPRKFEVRVRPPSRGAGAGPPLADGTERRVGR